MHLPEAKVFVHLELIETSRSLLVHIWIGTKGSGENLERAATAAPSSKGFGLADNSYQINRSSRALHCIANDAFESDRPRAERNLLDVRGVMDVDIPRVLEISSAWDSWDGEGGRQNGEGNGQEGEGISDASEFHSLGAVMRECDVIDDKLEVF